MPLPAGTHIYTSTGTYRPRRGSQDTESVFLQAFGDQTPFIPVRRPSPDDMMGSLERRPELLSRSRVLQPAVSNPTLDVSSMSSGWKSVALPATLSVTAGVSDPSHPTVLGKKVEEEEDEEETMCPQIKNNNKPEDTSEPEEEDGYFDPKISLTSFRRLSKTPIPTLAPTLTLSEGEAEEDSDASDNDTNGHEAEFFFPADSSQIITRKVVRSPDGQYRLQTSAGPVRFLRPDGSAVSSMREEDLFPASTAARQHTLSESAPSFLDKLSTAFSGVLGVAVGNYDDGEERQREESRQRMLSGRVVKKTTVDQTRRADRGVCLTPTGADSQEDDIDRSYVSVVNFDSNGGAVQATSSNVQNELFY
ncbi:hypothetical protein BV898_06074 [Hypsibius exemplaris]|uniref:Uncharacterized protein n=1 Tax=Hypsibius exemplaris TaxID=2072580 RepID=A0A1W0WXC4_HYPEX|nr:hypothetical protein BV898_06074 [Hypsibius exemplaris]